MEIKTRQIPSTDVVPNIHVRSALSRCRDRCIDSREGAPMGICRLPYRKNLLLGTDRQTHILSFSYIRTCIDIDFCFAVFSLCFLFKKLDPFCISNMYYHYYALISFVFLLPLFLLYLRFKNFLIFTSFIKNKCMYHITSKR